MFVSWWLILGHVQVNRTIRTGIVSVSSGLMWATQVALDVALVNDEFSTITGLVLSV
jgi:hypothetical protein